MQTQDTRRSDARRNHERVVDAAIAVFTERGLAATVPEVADRAGVGKATVYRNFPSRDDLVAEVVRHQLRWMEQRAAAALAEPEPVAALGALVTDMFAQLSHNRLLHDAMRSAVPDLGEHKPRIAALLDEAFHRTQAAGGIRADATMDDLRTLMIGCAQRLVDTGNCDAAAWARLGRLVLDAFRPPGAAAPAADLT